MSKKRVVALILVLLVIAALWFAFSRRAPSQVDLATEYFAIWSLKHGDGGEPVPESLMIGRDHRQYLLFSFVPQQDLPATFAEREVILPEEWPVVLVIYPENGDPNGPASVQRGFVEFDNAARFSKYATNADRTRHSRLLGGNAAPLVAGIKKPAIPKPARDGELSFYGLLWLPEAAPGNYVLELWFYPTARRDSPYRSSLGPPIVFHRGRLIVSEK